MLGNQIAEDGASTLGLLVLNDPYGTGLAAATKESFEAAGGEVVAEELFNTGDSNFDAQLSAIKAANPDAVAVITFDEAKVVVPALVGSGYPGDQLYFVDGNLSDYSADFAPGLIAGSKGTLPGPKLEDDFRERMLEVDPDLADFSYGPESYDATMLIALAAYAANSTEGADIAKYLRQVSGGTGDGEVVSTFTDGATLLSEGSQINYDGPSGPITLDENGDPTEATIGIYEYGDDNTYIAHQLGASSSTCRHEGPRLRPGPFRVPGRHGARRARAPHRTGARRPDGPARPAGRSRPRRRSGDTHPPGVRDGLIEAVCEPQREALGASEDDRHSALSSTHREHFSAPADVGAAVLVEITVVPGPLAGAPSGCCPRRSLADSRSAGPRRRRARRAARATVENRGRRGVPATDARPRVPARRAVRERGTTRRGRMPQHPPSSRSSSGQSWPSVPRYRPITFGSFRRSRPVPV